MRQNIATDVSVNFDDNPSSASHTSNPAQNAGAEGICNGTGLRNTSFTRTGTSALEAQPASTLQHTDSTEVQQDPSTKLSCREVFYLFGWFNGLLWLVILILSGSIILALGFLVSAFFGGSIRPSTVAAILQVLRYWAIPMFLAVSSYTTISVVCPDYSILITNMVERYLRVKRGVTHRLSPYFIGLSVSTLVAWAWGQW